MNRYIPLILSAYTAITLAGCVNREAPDKYNGTPAETLAGEFEAECFEHGPYRDQKLSEIARERKRRFPDITDKWLCSPDGLGGFQMVVEE